LIGSFNKESDSEMGEVKEIDTGIIVRRRLRANMGNQ
jgi:hypothetical protein